MKENIIEKKSYSFALETIDLYKKLSSSNEYVLSKQLLRSGTSIGANVAEGVRAQSRKDFISKMNIALKEANETEYWIKLLMDSKYIDRNKYTNYLNNCSELCRILNSIVKTSKENLYNTVEELLENNYEITVHKSQWKEMATKGCKPAFNHLIVICELCIVFSIVICDLWIVHCIWNTNVMLHTQYMGYNKHISKSNKGIPLLQIHYTSIFSLI